MFKVPFPRYDLQKTVFPALLLIMNKLYVLTWKLNKTREILKGLIYYDSENELLKQGDA